LPQLLFKVTVTSRSFHIQCVHLAAGRHNQAGDANDQWRDQPNAAIVCPTVLQLVNCHELSVFINYLLKGLPNSVINEI